MNLNLKQLFLDLDKHAAEFNFPVLDNAYVAFAAARLSAFRSSQNWLLIFEVLGFSVREVEFVNDLYAYGSCVKTEGFQGERILLASTLERPLFDRETNLFTADWSHFSIKLGHEILDFSPNRDEYSRAGIVIENDPGPGTLGEIELLRFLIHRFGERLFMNDQDLLSHFPLCTDTSKLLQTMQWQHPDVADGEKPSENISIRSLADVFSNGDPSFFNPGRPNTHWKFWTDGQEVER
jgi:hypothetical protein